MRVKNATLETGCKIVWYVRMGFLKKWLGTSLAVNRDSLSIKGLWFEIALVQMLDKSWNSGKFLTLFILLFPYL